MNILEQTNETVAPQKMDKLPWHVRNKERHAENCRKWRQANKDKHNEFCDNWIKNNRERNNENHKLRQRRYDQRQRDKKKALKEVEVKQ
jgi:hypothetical protein